MDREKDLALKVPEEWDFREIERDELSMAVEYEYARQRRHFRSSVTRILESRVANRAVRQMALDGKWKFNPSDPVEIFAWEHPLFPLPWMGFEKSDRLESRLRQQPECPLLVLDASEDRPFHNGFWIWVNFSQPIKTIVRDFAQWVQDEAKKQPNRPKRGKGSSAPFHKLKELAAYRLNHSGLNYLKAQEHIETHRAKVKTRSHFDVLPVYASAGAWHGAVAAAKKAIG